MEELNWQEEDGTYDEHENRCIECGKFTTETCDNCGGWVCSTCYAGKNPKHCCE